MIRVMIADDQIIVREGLKKILSLDNEIQVVCEAQNGQDVLKKLYEHVIDVILMDVRMPNMDGIETTNRVKKLFPDIKIIILTTFNEDEYLFNGIKSGISGYLLKDSEINYIIMSIKEVCKGKMIFDPSVTSKLINALSNNSKNERSLNLGKLDVLTDRETEILNLVIKGKSNLEISNTLFISEGTVKNYISKILKKLNLQRRTQLSALFINK